MNYLYPLIAIHFSGKTILLYSNEDVLEFVQKFGRFQESHIEFHQYRLIDGKLQPIVNDDIWIVRDDRGRVVKFDDIWPKRKPYEIWNKSRAKIRAIAAKGLPIPYTACRKAGRKMNHPAKKNSGAGHRNRNRALAVYEAKEYGIKNKLGRVIPWENY